MRNIKQAFRRIVALSLAVLLLPVEMLAQQGYGAPYPQSPQQGYPQQYGGYPQQQQQYPQQDAEQDPYPDQQAYSQQPDYQNPPTYGPSVQPLSAQQLEQLVAPIALY